MTSENEYIDADGVRYVAVESEPLSCRGCAFDRSSFSCPSKAPRCSERQRKDGRPVIWVKAEDGSRA